MEVAADTEPVKPRSSPMLSLLRILGLVVLLVVVLYPGLLFLFQRKLIYFPRGYEPIYRNGLPTGSVELAFDTPDGRQVAFYLPPTDATRERPRTLWVCFNGNASTALDWLDFAERYPGADRDAFLLVDLPGYGLSEGSPSRDGAIRNGTGALEALARHRGLEANVLADHLGMVGLSIGCATGLEFAARQPVERVILFAPFRSLLEMARRSVIPPAHHILLDRYDNRARLAELAARPSPPTVDIFHGRVDEIIPFEMAEALAAEFPQTVTFHPVDDADHNLVVLAAERRAWDIMNRDWPANEE